MTKLLKATAAIVLYKSKTLKDGTHPVTLRVTFARQLKYYTLGRCHVESWNKEANRYKKDKEANIKLNALESRAQTIVESYSTDGRPFTFRIFERDFLINADRKQVLQFILSQIDKLEKQDRAGSLSMLKTVNNSLKKFTKEKDFTWVDLDKKFLEDYETFLLKTCSQNGVAVYFRQIRVLYNQAINDGLVKREYYPFYEYKIKTEPVKKRALSSVQIEQLINYEAEEGTHEFNSRNYFILSYLLRGMNFVDLSRLKEVNIVEGRVQYIRSKTKTSRSRGEGRVFSLPIRPHVRELLNYYRKNHFTGSGYILPILKKVYPTMVAERWARQTALGKVNKCIQDICGELKIPDPKSVTFYSARHSYATITRREGARTEIIQEALGHNNIKTTQGYLADFGDVDLDKADQHLEKYNMISMKTVG